MVVLWDLNELDKGTMIAKVPASIYALDYDPQTDLLIVGQNFEGIQSYWFWEVVRTFGL